MNKQDRQKLRAKLARQATIKRFSMYGVMGIIVFITTAMIVLLSEGYYINPNNKQLIKNGLVFVDSAPRNASVTINGVEEKDRTESRFTLPEGKYDFLVRRDGYRDWQRSFLLAGSEVVNLNYVLLVPTTLTPKEVSTKPAPITAASQSPDQKWIVSHTLNAGATLDIVDMSRKDPASAAITIPATTLPTGSDTNAMQVVAWASDNQNFLVRVPIGNAVNYLVVNRSDANKTLNLNKEFGIEAQSIYLRDDKPDRFYAIDASGSLRELELGGKTISAPKFERVLAVKTYGADRLLVVQKDESSDSANYILTDKDNRMTIGQTTKQPREEYLLDIAEYDGDAYISVGSKADGVVNIYKNLFDNIKSQSITPRPLARVDIANPQGVSFSKNARFIAIQSGKEFVVFDNEYERTYRYSLPYDSMYLDKKVHWMDGDRLLLAAEGKQYIVDYDGINLSELATASNVVPLAFDRPFEQFYAFTNNESSSSLTRTSLLIEQ